VTILYIPHRGTLADAMAEVKKFSSIKEMCEYLVQDHENAFDVSDIVISYYCYDDRIDWETFIVKVKRYYNEKYTNPQAIGYCTMKGCA
jgi:hypothetical protein